VYRAVILALALVGCYAPSIRNQGYACDPTEEYSCPVGYRCIDGLCDDGSGGHPRMDPPAADDMAMTTSGDDDMASKAPADQATAVGADMAQSPPDMAQAPPDMAQSCTPLGGACVNDSDCCSQWCNWSTDRCVKHP
jgi:hypothetical protein